MRCARRNPPTLGFRGGLRYRSHPTLNILNAEDYFSPDYETARGRFRAAATAAGAALHAIALPGDRARTAKRSRIDIAWLGAPRPRRVFLHTSGCTASRRITGSAAQLALLDAPPAPGPRTRSILVHVLNPYGMAWLRRTNENNVDLNRNFLLNGEALVGRARALPRARSAAQSRRRRRRTTASRVRAAATAMRYGFHRVKQAVAEGQYEFPRGLFFGGHELAGRAAALHRVAAAASRRRRLSLRARPAHRTRPPRHRHA